MLDVASTHKKSSTELFIDDSSLENAQLPEVIEGEELLTWCQRVTMGYPGVKINDYTLVPFKEV